MHPVRVRRSEQQTERTPLGDAEQHRSLGFGGVEHGAQVRHTLLERRYRRHGIGQPGAGLVVHDHPRERRKALVEARDLGVAPLYVDVRDEARDDDEVDRAITEDLVGNLQSSAIDETCLGLLH
jgi:hypothetical protein